MSTEELLLNGSTLLRCGGGGIYGGFALKTHMCALKLPSGALLVNLCGNRKVTFVKILHRVETWNPTEVRQSGVEVCPGPHCKLFWFPEVKILIIFPSYILLAVILLAFNQLCFCLWIINNSAFWCICGDFYVMETFCICNEWIFRYFYASINKIKQLN